MEQVPPARTFGVEEEFALVDPRSGAVVSTAAAVVDDCRGDGLVTNEVMRYMVESRTTVCREVDELGRELVSTRGRIAEAARAHGAVAIASGVPPLGMPGVPPVTDEPRYLEMARRFPGPMRTSGTCSCHVHVGVPSREAGLAALMHLRPWLPVLVALTANSPVWRGRETTWASQRFRLVSRWSTAVPPPRVASPSEYDAAVAGAVSAGLAMDERSVYFLARLSPRYPTIEVRIADVPPTPQDTVLLASLVRAVVATALAPAMRLPVAGPSDDGLRRACLAAAKAGLEGRIVNPLVGARQPAREVLDTLVELVLPHLRAVGDEPFVVSQLARLGDVGSGAERQRRLFRAASSPAGLVAGLAIDTPQEPSRWCPRQESNLRPFA